MPRERIVACSALGELLAGRPDRPVRAVQRAVPRPRPRVRRAGRPARAARTSASWSTGTSSSCSSTRIRSARSRRCRRRTSTPAWASTAWRSILQGEASVFETDQFQPLIELGERAGRATARRPTTRALRILADHTRAMTFLSPTASCRPTRTAATSCAAIMRRAIQQGRRSASSRASCRASPSVVDEHDGRRLPRAARASATRSTSGSRAEEESFGRTLEQGTKLLDELIERARRRGIGAQDAFRLHDTYGFPIDLTREIAAERGLGVDEHAASSALMDEQRARRAARRGGARDAAARGVERCDGPSRRRSPATRRSSETRPSRALERRTAACS